MKIKTNYTFCVACFHSGANTWEHIIPDSIGGLLVANLLCEKCNSTFGSKLDAQFKNDPRFRLAIESLKDDLPKLHRDFNQDNPYVGTSKNGPPINMTSDNGKLILKVTKPGDGSILMNTPDLRNHLKGIWKKDGEESREIDERLERFDKAPNDEKFEINGGEYIKHGGDGVHPVLSGDFISDRLIAKIGYMHLSLCIPPQNLIIHREFFEPIMNFIKGGEKPEHITTQSGVIGSTYQTNHRFQTHRENNKTTLELLFFGAIGIKLDISGLSIPYEIPIFVHDLHQRKVLAAKDLKDFQEGKYRSIN